MVAFKRRQVELKAYLDSKNVTLEMMRTSDVVCFEAKLLVIALLVELEFYRNRQKGNLHSVVDKDLIIVILNKIIVKYELFHLQFMNT